MIQMKKCLALLLALVMIIGTLPMRASAEDDRAIIEKHMAENSLEFNTRITDRGAYHAKRGRHSSMEFGYLMENLQGVAGKTIYMEAELWYEGNDELVFVELYKNSVSEKNYIGTFQNVFDAPEHMSVGCEWNTKGQSAGNYIAVFGIAYLDGDEYYLAENSTKYLNFKLLKDPIPLKRIFLRRQYASRYEKRTEDTIPLAAKDKGYQVTLDPENTTDCRYVDAVSSDPKMLSVTERAGTFFLTPNRMGTCTVNVSVAQAKASLAVTINNPATATDLNQTTATIHQGKTLQLIASPTPSNTTDSLTWSSSNTKIATVDQNGLVKAIGSGTAKIKAQYGSTYRECKVTVEAHSFEEEFYSGISCTTPDSTMGTCTICGFLEEHIVLPARGHKWVEDEPTEPEENGTYLHFTCARCGATRTRFMPASNECSGENCPTTAFVDMPLTTNWAHIGIDFAVSRGLFAGMTKDTFGGDKSMQRGMLVTVLWRLDGQPEPENPVGFTDVAQEQYYAKAVAWASENGVVAGVGDNKFNPKGNVTREQLAAFLYRYAKLRGYDVYTLADIQSFIDYEKVSAYAYNPMCWAVAEKLVSGSATAFGLRIDPRGNATREQVAAILMRFAYEVIGSDLSNRLLESNP